MIISNRWKVTLAVLWYGFVVGGTLALFGVIPGWLRYVLALAGLWLGYRFFRRHESLAARIWFFVVGISFYFLMVLLASIIIYSKTHT